MNSRQRRKARRAAEFEALWCCYGAAIYGRERCTCGPPYRVPKAPEPSVVRSDRCRTCALRAGSPEHQNEVDPDGDAPVASSWQGVIDLASKGEPFYCHHRMRRRKGDYPPTFQPDYDPDGTPMRKDGKAADMCAGWAELARYFGHDPEAIAAAINVGRAPRPDRRVWVCGEMG